MAKFPNNKVYIGKTKNLERRIKQHITASKKPKLPFHHAIIKYGTDNIEWIILKENVDNKDINKEEIFFINKFNSNINFNGYNVSKGGDGGDTISLNENKNEIMIKQLKSKGVDNYVIIDENLRKEIINKYINENFSLRKLSNYYNITKNRLKRLLKNEGIIINQNIAIEINSKKIDTETLNNVISEYKKNKTIKLLAKEFNLTIMIVSRILHDSGERLSKRFNI
jgi:group I intron endonuclease